MIERRSFTHGLTLIELIIVLVISAIISSVVIPNYNRLHIKAKYSYLTQTAYSIQMAIETFFLYHGAYPNLDSIDTLISLLKQEALMKQVPTNPFTNKPFSNQDSAGKITYGFDSISNIYTMEVFDDTNEHVLLLLGN